MPSPQNPDSSSQVEVQPSKSRRFPSSHSSVPFMRPSPQIPEAATIVTSISQIALQPSPDLVFPSSQFSPMFTLPSPQLPGVRDELEPPEEPGTPPEEPRPSEELGTPPEEP